jgi:hypothetical protein
VRDEDALYRVVRSTIRRIPTTPIHILRFPDGDFEYRSTRGELPVGTLLRARGSLWRVMRFEGSSAFLESAEASVEAHGGPSGPLVIPDPLGDKPLTLEVIAEV